MWFFGVVVFVGEEVVVVGLDRWWIEYFFVCVVVCELFFEVVVIEGKEFIGEYVIDDYVVYDCCVECY